LKPDLRFVELAFELSLPLPVVEAEVERDPELQVLTNFFLVGAGRSKTWRRKGRREPSELFTKVDLECGQRNPQKFFMISDPFIL